MGDYHILKVKRGPKPNHIFDLEEGLITVGRDVSNDVVISDIEVSRFHCQLVWNGEGYQIEDLEATNGTFVNGERVANPRPLRRGDRVGLGEAIILTYSDEGDSDRYNEGYTQDSVDVPHVAHDHPTRIEPMNLAETPAYLHAPDFLEDPNLFDADTAQGFDMPLPSLFVSYAAEDSDFAYRLASDLRAEGFRVWIDLDGLGGGEQQWTHVTEQALNRSDHVVVVISPDAMASRGVGKEVMVALQWNKNVISALWHGHKLPAQLRDLDYVDFRTHYDDAFDDLLALLG
ncbi:MAG: TIR domain-containing protein [Anaerolineae bacterium]|nr:TIR domain-containing protein [Anaerolineae bacterium]